MRAQLLSSNAEKNGKRREISPLVEGFEPQTTRTVR